MIKEYEDGWKEGYIAGYSQGVKDATPLRPYNIPYNIPPIQWPYTPYNIPRCMICGRDNNPNAYVCPHMNCPSQTKVFCY